MPTSPVGVRLTRVRLALAALLLVLSIAPVHAQGSIALHIRVIDSVERSAIPGAKVWLPGAQETPAYADESGEATLAVRREPSADTLFYASAPGHKAFEGLPTRVTDKKTGQITFLIKLEIVDSITLHISVIDSVKRTGIPGAKVWLRNGFWPGAEERAAVAYTDQSGDATITVRLETQADTGFYASAAGYKDYRGLRIRMSREEETTFSFELEQTAGTFATVTVRDNVTKEAIAGADVVFNGKGMFGATYSGATAGNGVAQVPIDAGGDYTLEVRAEGFQTASKAVRVSLNSGANETIELTSRTDAASSTARMDSKIAATVLAGGKPLPGATLRQNGVATVTTDANGQAVLQGYNAPGDDVIVIASADGYKSQSKTVTLQPRLTARQSSAAVTFVLLPGEDPVSESTPIQLKIIFLDKYSDTPVAGVTADLRFANGKRIDTNERSDDKTGAIHFRLEDSDAVPLAMVRTGVSVLVYPGNDYVQPSPYAIAPASLASSEEVPITIFITPKRLPEDVRKFLADLAILEVQVRGVETLRNDFEHRTATPLGESEAALGQAQDIAKWVRSQLTPESIVGTTNDACRGRNFAGGVTLPEVYQDLEDNIRTGLSGVQKIGDMLQEAKRAVDRCKPEDAARVKDLYRNSLQQLHDTGALEKKLRVNNTKLTVLKRMTAGAPGILGDLTAKTAELQTLARAARTAANRAATDTWSAANAAARVRQEAADAETSRAKVLADYNGLIKAGRPGISASEGKTLEAMRAALEAAGKVNEADARQRRDQINANAIAIQNWRDTTQKLLADAAPPSTCAIKTYDTQLDDLSAKILDAELEIGVDADLPGKADACGTNNGCRQLTDDIRNQMESGAIERAEANIKVAKAKACPLGDIEQQLGTARDVRNAALAIRELTDQCRFADAAAFANRIPVQYQALSIIQDELARLRIGTKEQATVKDLVTRANAAAQRGDQTGAEALMRNAQREASLDGRWYACVSPLISAAILPPPGTAPVSPRPAAGAAPSGPLTAKVQVKPGRQEGPGGGDTYSYGPTSASVDSIRSDGQVHVRMTFEGVPQSLTPGQEITITVGASVSSQPAAYGAGWNVTASVVAVGLEVVSAVSAGRSRPGKYVFRVPLNATSAIITLNGDFGLGDAAVYTYTGKP